MALFKNRQWQVTPAGMSTVSPSPRYDIPAWRLLDQTRRERTYYDWPIHLAAKEWVNVAAFVEAFTAALDHHRGHYQGQLNEDLLTASAAAASAISREAQATRMSANRGTIKLGKFSNITTGYCKGRGQKGKRNGESPAPKARSAQDVFTKS